MKRGISFKIPQEKTNILWKILGGIDIAKYWWYNIISQTEIWGVSDFEDFLEDHYRGKDFAEHIQNEHFVLFVKLQAYASHSNFQNIPSFEEYIESDCQIVLLINDCEFVEIYAKDQTVVESLFFNAQRNGFKLIRYLTDETDTRTTLNVR